MKPVKLAMVIAGALVFAAVGAHAGLSGNCSPEGTWYGYNDGGAIWIVTITRSGPDSFTTVMDWSGNGWEPPVAAGTDWRGEFVKTGPESYDWTTMALLRGDPEASPIPFALGYCPLQAEFTGCDSWQGEGVCSYYAFPTYDADPFGDLAFKLWDDPPLQAFFKRMPMSYPE